MKGEIERMEINYTLYFFAIFEKVIKKTIDILLLEKQHYLLLINMANIILLVVYTENRVMWRLVDVVDSSSIQSMDVRLCQRE